MESREESKDKKGGWEMAEDSEFTKDGKRGTEIMKVLCRGLDVGIKMFLGSSSECHILTGLL